MCPGGLKDPSEPLRRESTVPRRPMVNPDVDEIADEAKHGYATGTKLLAEMHYRLAELAGSGQLDPEESMTLQDSLIAIWEQLYYGTVFAVRDIFNHEWTDDEADNTYSDGRQVMTQVPRNPEQPDVNWGREQLVSWDGAAVIHPRGMTSRISPIDPADDQERPMHRPCSESNGERKSPGKVGLDRNALKDMK